MLKRLDLPDGQWADLLTKPTHADYVAILEATDAVMSGTLSEARWMATVGARYVKAWYIRADDGTPLAYGAWDDLDADLSDAICTEALNRWKEWRESRVPLVEPRPWRTSPLTPETSSDDTSEDEPSTSPTTP